jgi:flagella basal body P-ring formation protein FlgA
MYLLCLILSVFFWFSGNLSHDEINEYLKKQLTGYSKIEFETVSLPRIKFKDDVSIDLTKDFKLSGNTAYIPVMIKSQNSAYPTSSFVVARVKLYKEVLTARSPIKRGTELKKDDFQTEIADVSTIRGKIINDEQGIETYKAKFNIEQKEVLTETLIEPVPAIKRGNKVIAYSISGRVAISMDASAREDGCLGDIIRIITPDKKIFRAKVIDSLNVNIIQ